MFSKKFIATILTINVLGFLITNPVWAQCKVLLFGDSLTAGYGLSEQNTFPALLQKNLGLEVINGGVSGDTTSSGLARIEWSLADVPDLVVVELGANDMLRGLPNAQTKSNLRKILTKIQEKNIPIILAGMRALPNLGRAYAAEFDKIYPDLAQELAIPLYPFFLDGVAANPHLNQDDGIHPNADGNKEIVKRFAPMIKATLAKHCD